MIPQEFDYAAPSTLREALDLIGSGERKALAGGMSLIPLMKLRLAAPAEVVDLGRIPGLNGISEGDGMIRIGAMATHHEVESSRVVRSRCPLLAEAASLIGDVQVRNMGTIGGSVAHADPAADYPASLLALEAQIKVASANSERTIAAADFFVDAFTTTLDPGELIVEISVPVEEPREGYSYQKLSHPASGFAVVGVAARVKKSGGRVSMAHIGVTGMAARAFRASNVEEMLLGGADAAAAAAVLGEGEEGNSDLYASGDYRRHLARVYGARAIQTALSRTS
jgi:carbon-monoxide dehydrogenase medium subunit